jgi:hypothetical protein
MAALLQQFLQLMGDTATDQEDADDFAFAQRVARHWMRRGGEPSFEPRLDVWTGLWRNPEPLADWKVLVEGDQSSSEDKEILLCSRPCDWQVMSAVSSRKDAHE